MKRDDDSTVERIFEIGLAILGAAFVAALFLIAFVFCAGCSTGKVEMGAKISCLALSVEPQVRFDGINLGLPVTTNVVCGCEYCQGDILNHTENTEKEEERR